MDLFVGVNVETAFRSVLLMLFILMFLSVLFSHAVLFVPPEKLSQAKEENLGMHQVLDQTLMELNNL